jgi:hypothetical protein
MNEIESSNQESVMPKKRGKQLAGKRYKSSLIPMAVSAKPRRRKTRRIKR